MADTAAQLLGRETVAPFKAKLISKWPGTGGYGLHQDYPYWTGVEHVPPDAFVTAMVALDDFTPHAGAVEWFPGLHRSVLPGHPENPLDVDPRSIANAPSEMLEGHGGDVIWFHALLPHRSEPNRTQHNRQALFLTYITAEKADLSQVYYRKRPVDFMDPG